MSIELEMQIVQLRSEISHLRTVVSRSINILEQVKIALEDDDHDEALKLVSEALGEHS